MTRYRISDGSTDLEVDIADGTDFDSRFEAWDVDTGERLMVNGWLILDIEEVRP